MTTILEGYVRRGWKVFLGGERVGEVTDVGHDDITVKRGTLRKHTFRVPIASVVQAGDGVVDLRDDARTKDLLDPE